MPLNFGIATGPPRKKSGLPPKVGEKPHMTVVIAAAVPKGKPKPKPPIGGDEGDDDPTAGVGGPSFLRAAGAGAKPSSLARRAPPMRGPAPAPAAAPDEGDDEGLEGLGGGGGEEPGEGAEHPILPEAVNYRSEQETCQNCIHMQDDGECERLHIPVAQGDGCNLFTDSSGKDADESAEQFEPEEAGEGQEENEPAYR